MGHRARTGIDIGCGAGYYVSQWRSRGLAFAGYDANPRTPDLSGMLLPEGDAVCEVADLTEELDISTPFDIVVCKDVLPYIPENRHPRPYVTSHAYRRISSC